MAEVYAEHGFRIYGIYVVVAINYVRMYVRCFAIHMYWFCNIGEGFISLV